MPFCWWPFLSAPAGPRLPRAGSVPLFHGPDGVAIPARANPLMSAFRDWNDESPPPSQQPFVEAPRALPLPPPPRLQPASVPLVDPVDSLVDAARHERAVAVAPLPAQDAALRVEDVLQRAGLNTGAWAGFFLARHFGLSLAPERVLEWLTDDGHQAELIAFVIYLFDFEGLDLEPAFRLFVQRLRYLPSEGQKQTRLVEAFAVRYHRDCGGARGGFRSVEAVSALAMGMFMLNTMLHNARVAKQFQFDSATWVAHNAGRNGGQDYDRGMLIDIYDNVRDDKIVFEDAAPYPSSVKHGWLSVRPAGALRTRRMWVELEGGVLHMLRAPGPARGAVTALRLDGARIMRHEDALGFTIAPREPPQKETHFGAASSWACQTWVAACAAVAAVAPAPAPAAVVPAVVANPVYCPAPPRRSSLVEVPNPVFDAALGARPGMRSSLSLNDVHSTGVTPEVRVLNPLFVAASKRSSLREVENPVFGHDPSLLSPPHNEY